jgi:hypothetical protein
MLTMNKRKQVVFVVSITLIVMTLLSCRNNGRIRTHPDPDVRIQRMRENISRLGVQPKNEQNISPDEGQ